MVRKLQEEGLADDRLACAGKSYGGYLSAWAIGNCERFKAAAVAAPVANLLSHMSVWGPVVLAVLFWAVLFAAGRVAL